MKTIRIHGVEQEVPTGTVMFEEFITGLNKTLETDKHVISSIRLNGQQISENDEAGLKNMPIDQIGDLQVLTANPADLAYETLNTLDLYIDRLIAGIERAATHYKGKSLITGDSYFAKS